MVVCVSGLRCSYLYINNHFKAQSEIGVLKQYDYSFSCLVITAKQQKQAQPTGVMCRNVKTKDEMPLTVLSASLQRPPATKNMQNVDSLYRGIGVLCKLTITVLYFNIFCVML